MADEQPIPIIDHLHIELEVIRVSIEGLLQAETLTAILQLPQNIAADIHLPILAQYQETGEGHARPVGTAQSNVPTARRGQ
jgi:hypothetical protein